MVNQLKIAISGKLNSGKNTTASIIEQQCRVLKNKTTSIMAFADPIKEMVSIMLPNLPRNYLFGSSKYREEIIPNFFKDNVPLTVRQILIDLGTKFGRAYDDKIWIDNLDNKIKKNTSDIIVVTDLRFPNEFSYLKENSFLTIRLLRNFNNSINDESETSQNNISDSDFDYIIDNNGTLEELKAQIINIIGKKL